MEATGLLTRRAPLAILAAMAMLLLAVPAAEAVFAGKPGRIAYSAELPGEDKSTPAPPPPRGTVDRGFDVFTVNPDGSDLRRLTQNAAEPNDERQPAWSPGGSLLAFSARFPFAPNQFGPYPVVPESEIDLIAPDGSARRTILDYFEEASPSSPTFSPDGARLIYAWTIVDGLSRGIRSVDLNGSDRRDLDPSLFDNYGSHVSPDSRRKVTSSGGDIVISRLDGSDAENLTNTPGVFEHDPALAPDMSAVVFVRQSGTPPFPGAIVVLDLESGSERVVSPPGQNATEPDWGAIPVNCAGRRATIVGTEGRDKLVGTKGRDVIAGLGGRDRIKGKRGRDVLCGGKGKDRLSGNKGKDRLLGGKGKDRCLGGKGRDRAKGCEREKKI